jgi:hypothetical protein
MKRVFLIAVLISVLSSDGCTVPAWVNTVEADAKVAAPIAASLIDVIDPALAPLVTVVSSGFTALVNTLDTYKASPTATNLQAVEAAFKAVDANVAQLESAAQIKNAATASEVTQIVALLGQAVTEIGALVPASVGVGIRGTGYGIRDTGLGQAGAQVAPSTHVAKGWTAKDFKRKFNQIVAGDPRFKPLK